VRALAVLSTLASGWYKAPRRTAQIVSMFAGTGVTTHELICALRPSRASWSISSCARQHDRTAEVAKVVTTAIRVYCNNSRIRAQNTPFGHNAAYFQNTAARRTSPAGQRGSLGQCSRDLQAYLHPRGFQFGN
jgi:hypothetical protein